MRGKDGQAAPQDRLTLPYNSGEVLPEVRYS